MSRAIAGVFDPAGSADRSRVAGSIGPSAALVQAPRLAVAHSGEATSVRDPLCLLAGFVDNLAAVCAAADRRPGQSTEARLAAEYRRRGAGLLAELRGDFALLLWDEQRGQGLIARDQLGVRSLYVHEAGLAVYFASEVHHLLALLPRRPAPDPTGVAHWLAAGERAGRGTMYEGVRSLAPASVLELGPDGARERRYWTPSFSEPVEDGVEDGEEQLGQPLRDALTRAVRRRLADQRDLSGTSGTGAAGTSATTGVLMSGGLDSSVVAALAAGEAPGRVAAFSGVFPDHPSVDESQPIELLRGQLSLGGVTAEVRAGGLLASALELQRTSQLPLLSWGDFWTRPLLSAAAGNGVQVMLGGDGGDELFATRIYLLADRLRAGDPRGALALTAELPGAGDAPPLRTRLSIAAQVAVAGALPLGAHEAIRRRLSRSGGPAWLRPAGVEALRASGDPLAWQRMDGPRWWAHGAAGLSNGIAQAGIFEMHRLRAADAGLEARHPLLDLDLVELVLRQPPLRSFDRYVNRPALRACMAGLLPDAVRLQRRKARFDALIVDTLAGADAPAVRRLLGDPRAELGAHVDLARARCCLLDDDALRRRSPFDWMQQVWRLATAECWLRAQAGAEHEQLSELLKASPARVSLRRVGATKSMPATAKLTHDRGPLQPCA